jgi:hypothetical protein
MLNAECHNETKNKFYHFCERYDGQQQKITITTLQERLVFLGQCSGVEICVRRYELGTKICPRKWRQRNEWSHTSVGFCM